MTIETALEAILTTSAKSQPFNPEQTAAIELMLAFLDDPEEFYFVLKGSAGTGKTYCIRELPNRIKGRIVYTATTNKATKELRRSVTTKEYKPDCRTIFSLLGLRLEASGEVKELSAPEDPVDLSSYRVVVVDESSMINENLRAFIKQAAEEHGCKFIFMGDPAQLPPVGEARSPIWRIKNGAELLKVERHDNQILALATRIRNVVDHPAPTIRLLSDHDADDSQGVWLKSRKDFDQMIRAEANIMGFSRQNGSKAIAWRNVTVDGLNKMIRDTIFDNPAEFWLPTDRVIFTSPAKDLDDETIATTDDEGEINRVDTEYHPIHGDCKIYRISITLDDGPAVVARVLHQESQLHYNKRCEELAAAAKSNGRLWGKFWDFKDAFHSLRHAYAVTAHRAQGSTYDTAFVDYRDILLNRNRQEAYRCLYVACTRPKRALVLG
jgi:exodeoxyribonuclease-5